MTEYGLSQLKKWNFVIFDFSKDFENFENFEELFFRSPDRASPKMHVKQMSENWKFCFSTISGHLWARLGRSIQSPLQNVFSRYVSKKGSKN